MYVILVNRLGESEEFKIFYVITFNLYYLEFYFLRIILEKMS